MGNSEAGKQKRSRQTCGNKTSRHKYALQRSVDHSCSRIDKIGASKCRQISRNCQRHDSWLGAARLGLLQQRKNFSLQQNARAGNFEKLLKGSLYDILYLNRSLNLTIETKINFVREILLGINYIHQSPIKIIGNLTSRNCMIDSRFHIRIGDFDLATCNKWIRKQGQGAENSHYHDLEEEKLLWIAPEVRVINLVS